jgi:hypothetical protein
MRNCATVYPAYTANAIRLRASPAKSRMLSDRLDSKNLPPEYMTGALVDHYYCPTQHRCASGKTRSTLVDLYYGFGIHFTIHSMKQTP